MSSDSNYGNVGLAPASGTTIEKLRGCDNYNNWKYQMKLLLTLEGLWNVIDGTDTNATHAGRALARIGLSVSSSCYQHIREANTAQEAWNNLKTAFEDRGLFRRVLLLRKLHHMEYKEFNNMTLYIENVMSTVQQLADIDRVIEDSEIVELLLSGLPESFDALVSNLETASLTSTLKSDVVRARLLQEESRKKQNDNSEETAYFSAPKGKSVSGRSGIQKKVICHYCHKMGHVKAKCFKLRRDKKGDKNFNHSLLATDTTATAFFVRSQDFFIDSGASSHMCNDKRLLRNFQQFEDGQNKVLLANNQKISAEGCGELELKDSLTIDKVCSTNLECETCLLGKQVALPFPVVATRASKPLEIIHTDLAGPMQQCSFGGAKYLATFTDDYTRKTYGYLLKSKSEIAVRSTAPWREMTTRGPWLGRVTRSMSL